MTDSGDNNRPIIPLHNTNQGYRPATLSNWLKDNASILMLSVSLLGAAGTGIAVVSGDVAAVNEQLAQLNSSILRIESQIERDRAEVNELQLDMRTMDGSIAVIREGLAQAWVQIHGLSSYIRHAP